MIFISDILCRTGLEANVTGTDRTDDAVDNRFTYFTKNKSFALGELVKPCDRTRADIFGVYSIIKCPKPK